jgi:hypothetical protein
MTTNKVPTGASHGPGLAGILVSALTDHHNIEFGCGGIFGITRLRYLAPLACHMVVIAHTRHTCRFKNGLLQTDCYKSLLHTYLPRAPRLLVRQIIMPLFQTSLATERPAVIKRTKTKDRPIKEVGWRRLKTRGTPKLASSSLICCTPFSALFRRPNLQYYL